MAPATEPLLGGNDASKAAPPKHHRQQVGSCAIFLWVFGVIGALLMLVFHHAGNALLDDPAFGTDDARSCFAQDTGDDNGVLGCIQFLICTPIPIWGGLFYIVHLLEAAGFSKAASYLRNIQTPVEIAKHIKKMKAALPAKYYKIECYHQDPKKNSDQNPTSKAEEKYPVQGQIDETLTPAQMIGMMRQQGLIGGSQQDSYLLIHFDIDVQPCTPQVEKLYEEKKTDFYNYNTTTNFPVKTERLEVDGHVERMTVVLHEGEGVEFKPWWLHSFPYYVSCLLLLSIPYRFYMYSKCELIEWTILKHYSHEPQAKLADVVPMRSRRNLQDPQSKAFNAATLKQV